MEEHLKRAGEKVLNLAYDLKVRAEAFLMYNRELSIEVADREVETLKQAEEIGLGIRIINEGRLGFAYTSDLSDKALQEALLKAAYISRYTEMDIHNNLTSENYNYISLPVYDEEIEKENIENKIDLAREIERTARDKDNRITVVERSGYEDTFILSVIMNTEGLNASAKANFCRCYIFLIAEEDGDAQNGFAVMTKRRLKDISPIYIGEEAAINALRSLKPRSIVTGKMPCIMEPYVATRFLSIIAAAVSADAVQKGKSMLADKIGEKIGSSNLTVIDDALYAEGIGAFPFDGEGVASKTSVVIENGVLKGFLYDNYTASKAGIKSTGNGQRGSFRSLPGVGTTNFIIRPGGQKLNALLGDIRHGFYITEVIGMHTANPITGEFSVGAAGFMIEKGKLTYPVKGATIAGNLIDLLNDIEGIGDEIRFYGARAAPFLRIKSMSIGGN